MDFVANAIAGGRLSRKTPRAASATKASGDSQGMRGFSWQEYSAIMQRQPDAVLDANEVQLTSRPLMLLVNASAQHFLLVHSGLGKLQAPPAAAAALPKSFL